ncbi:MULTISPECIES: hypothetical protein [unclassified Chamaesiphon]|nr:MULTISPECIES: hypothetical protein [unclassified Chamaesiphon]
MTVLSGPGNCPLTDCHPGTYLIGRFVWGWDAALMKFSFSKVAQVRPQQK